MPVARVLVLLPSRTPVKMKALILLMMRCRTSRLRRHRPLYHPMGLSSMTSSSSWDWQDVAGFTAGSVIPRILWCIQSCGNSCRDFNCGRVVHQQAACMPCTILPCTILPWTKLAGLPCIVCIFNRYIYCGYLLCLPTMYIYYVYLLCTSTMYLCYVYLRCLSAMYIYDV